MPINKVHSQGLTSSQIPLSLQLFGNLNLPLSSPRGTISAGNLRVGDCWTFINMSLACLVCNSVESPSHSFRSYSVSSSDNEGRCAMANCLIWRPSLPPTHHPSYAASAKVTPQPNIVNSDGMDGTPRLVRSRAVRRDLVRDWNFDEVVVVEH